MVQSDGPWRITFETNPFDCNLKCIMCERQSTKFRSEAPHRGQMDIGLVDEVISDCVSHGLKEVIPSTMGEPLLYQHFEDIIDICSRDGAKLNLTTNGTFPGWDPRELAFFLAPVASDVKISWNGASARVAESIMKGIDYAGCKRKLVEFLRARDEIAAESGRRFTITLQVTFMEANVKELPLIVRFGGKAGVDRVKGHHLWVHDDTMKNQYLLRSRESTQSWNDSVRSCIDEAGTISSKTGRTLRLENFVPFNGASARLACPFLSKEAWVSLDGTFNPCCAPDHLRGRLGQFGNVTDVPLIDIWKGKEYSRLCKHYMTKEVCKECRIRIR